MKKCGIYGLRNIVNGKRCAYWNEYLQRAFNKYSHNNFEFRVLEEVPEYMLDVREMAWIEFYKVNQNQVSKTKIKEDYNER